MNITAHTYSASSNKTIVSVQLNQRKSSTVVLVSHAYEVTIDGAYDLGSEELEDAVVDQLELAGIPVAPMLG